jgi:hypothetical protein
MESNNVRIRVMPEYVVDQTNLLPDGLTMDDETSVAYMSFIHQHVSDFISYFEARDALHGSEVITLDENSNKEVVRTPSQDTSGFPSFSFPEDYSTPMAAKVVKSGVSRHNVGVKDGQLN